MKKLNVKSMLWRYVLCLMLVLGAFQIWQNYPKTTIQLLAVQPQQHSVQLKFQSSKDFGTRGSFEVNSRLFCVLAPNAEFASRGYQPTGEEYMGFISKEPAVFDAVKQVYLYDLEVNFNAEAVEARPQGHMQCRVLTGRYIGGFLASNVILFQL